MRTAVTDPLIGTVLDRRYRVDRRIARGGMSTVYAGTDLRLDRTVAIKVMARELAEDPAFVARFGQEARAAARLSHPNVVAVYDQGADRGRVFLVMELVRGRTLRALLRERGRLAPELATTILAAVLAALDAAHRAGLVHRDVKPENILLADDQTVKVADFGLVQALAGSHGTGSTGAVFGTVGYVAPEQVGRGTSDTRTDVYSAGIVLYEMLTGSPPYIAESPVSVAYRHVHDDVPPPSVTVPGLPEELDALTLRATRREPGARPVDAGAFLAELRDVRADLGLRTVPLPPPTGEVDLNLPRRSTARFEPPQPPEPPRDLEQSRHRRRFLVGIALVVVLGALAGTAGWWFGSGRLTSVPDLARLTLAEARTTAQAHHLQVEVLPGRAHSDTVPVGAIVSTEPGAGSTVPRDSTVEVRLSSGPERYVVPGRLIGATRHAAAAVLARMPLHTTYSAAYDGSVPAGHVVRIDPKPGTSLRRGARVGVVISRGPPPVTVPNVRGEGEEQAAATLRAAGLRANVTRRFDAAAAGTVLSQDPATGVLPRGTAVTLVVSKGPQLAAVPNVVREPARQAGAELRAAGFRPRVAHYFGGSFGIVISQAPAAGTMLAPGSTVEIVVF